MAEQNCNLSYSDLEQLSERLFALADRTRADYQAAADIRNAARAVSDLASLRFALKEIVADSDAVIAIKLEGRIGRESQ